MATRLYRKTKGLFKGDRIVSLVFTALVVALIFFSGSAMAFVISILSPDKVRAGEEIDFDVKICMNSGERIPIDKITINITGPAEGIRHSVSCVVYLNNTFYCFDKISDQATSDISITNIDLSGVDYGYGYLYGYWQQSAYGYGYIVSPDERNYAWGYGYGYGYAQGSGCIVLNVKWKVPIIPTIYTIKAGAYADGKLFEVEKEIEVLPPIHLPNEKGSAKISRDITAGEEVSEDFGNFTDLSLTLRAKSNLKAEINVSTSSENIVGIKPHNLEGVKFFVINVDPKLNENLEYAIIRMGYNDSEISGLDENSLRIYKWNGTQWIELPCPSFDYDCVDTANNFVYANVTSFSLFGVFGSQVAPTTSTTTTTTSTTTTTTTIPPTTTTTPSTYTPTTTTTLPPTTTSTTTSTTTTSTTTTTRPPTTTTTTSLPTTTTTIPSTTTTPEKLTEKRISVAEIIISILAVAIVLALLVKFFIGKKHQ